LTYYHFCDSIFIYPYKNKKYKK